MIDQATTQALQLLETAQRQIDAARALLGAGDVTRRQLEAAGVRVGPAADGTCPRCREKAPKVKESMAADAKTICGGCAYVYG